MAKQYRKEISFQAGEVSPLLYGRSETEFYDKGLAVANNVSVEKRGGIFRRQGLEHFARGDGNDGRVFTKQININRFDTIFLKDLEMIVYAPGASFLSPNLVSNPNFLQAGTDWTVNADPAGSTVTFANGAATLSPDQSITDLVVNGDFDEGVVGWNERSNDIQGTIVFADSQCTLTPRSGGGGAGTFVGIWQTMTTTVPGEVHNLVLEGVFNSEIEVKIGTGEDDGTDLDIIVTNAAAPITFVPSASPFTLTINALHPNVQATLGLVQILDPADSIAGISQEITITATQVENHLLQVIQTDLNQINIKVGTSANADDIASLVTGDLSTNLIFVPNNPTVWVTVEAIGSAAEEAVITFVGAVSAVDAGTGGLSMPAPWTEEQLPDVHMIQSPNGEAMYFTHPRARPQKLVYSFSSDLYTNLDDVVFTALPPTWGFADNWPATGTFFQGRLWYGATPEEPQTIWASVSGSPDDFTITGGQDSSSMEFTLQQFGRIQWMLGTKDILIGAENGEHILSSDGPVIIPTDFDVRQQSAYGSSSMQAIQVGEKVFYMTPDGRRLQSMSYQWQENNWLSQDLTFASEHITKGLVRQRAWLQNPGALLGLTLKNGDIAIVTYDRTAETVGWALHHLEGFKVLDIGVGLINGVSKMVLLGQRVSGKLDIEISGASGVYMDSYTTALLEPPGNVLTGLDHLDGDTVQVVVDGAVEPSKVVVGGQITTERTGSRITAGIQIKSKVVTLPPDVPQTSIRSWKKRWNKVWALLHDSNPPIINGIRPPDRTPSTPMDTPEPARSTHYKTVNIGWDDFGQITIEEDLPVAMNLLAIYGEMGAENL